MKKRGVFIVLEGLDRCGKTTQVTKLMEFLKKKEIPFKEMEFPSRDSPTGKIIDEFLTKKRTLNGQTIHLLYTTNRWERNEEILETLEKGVSIVCSRYSYSGLAYSAAKVEMDFKWCMYPEVGLPCPDVVIYLKADSSTIKERPGFGDEAYEKVSFQERVAIVFDKIIEHDKSPEGDNVFCLVNASRTIEEVHADISKIVEEYRNQERIPEVKKLWSKIK